MLRNIIAISGGGFSYSIPSYIDEYIVNQKRLSTSLKICFISTASNDAQGYIDQFYKAFSNFEASHLIQDDFLKENIKEFVMKQDVLYVGGGNTQYMLTKWREIEFDKILREAYENGIILAGISAGAMCWFDTCYSEREDGIFEEFKGLGFVQGSFCPHYNNEFRRKAYDKWLSTKSLEPNYKLEDNESLHFRNENLIARIIT
ncbi:peptidase E [Bacillus sp. M6-12]|uniref:Type 1 glutamine amidotransferase-like domain-containing protein n=1 Tax=Bacillus sp. M6-12 TaxID=2054166 RepID=UPI000C770562|nr:peptidase E [Bacillus sp. M6-12]PLS17353.1 peptidase E [Bacillus sp. M6-12]